MVFASGEPALTSAEPHVRIARSADVLAATPDAQRLLTPEWRSRWERFRQSQDADDFLAARVAAYQLLADLAPAAASRDVLVIDQLVIDQHVIEQRCDGCGRGGHGRPRVLGAGGKQSKLAISWAHSHGVVAVASGMADGLGIDLERADPDRPIAPEVDVPGRHFVRAEALVKAGAFDLDAGLQADLSWPWGGVERYQNFLVRDVPVDGDGLLAVVAWRPFGGLENSPSA